MYLVPLAMPLPSHTEGITIGYAEQLIVFAIVFFGISALMLSIFVWNYEESDHPSSICGN